MRKLLPLILALSLPLAACGDSTGPGEQRVDGTYTLVQLNGQAPPVTVFQSAAGRVEITGATLLLRPDFSYRETINVRGVPATGAPVTQDEIENGTYTVVGNSITFTIPASGGEPSYSYTGAVSGNTVTYTFEGLAFVYRK
ncbi:MAG: hypothetical protein H0X52_04100 [Gemmatimonadetes bacterium]|nr:hypothetical protein [Gemmatimonadota bacterium]